jgi:hypothetical protein
MQSSFSSGGINFRSEQLMNYFDLPAFFIVGASEDRNKFGIYLSIDTSIFIYM